MATFECKVYKLKIEEHPNADALELAVVGDYRSIVLKNQFKNGDLGVYIPEGAVLPDWLITQMGLEGRLAGKQHNRVKAIKLRKVLSQGLVYPVGQIEEKCFIKDRENHSHWIEEGDNVTDFLDITKYEPPIPTCLSGEVFNAHGMTLSYDIENYKLFPDVLVENEPVFMTEKIHGTWVSLGFHPDSDVFIVTSKGLSDKGLAFKFNEVNEKNTYIRALNNTVDENGKNIIERGIALFGTAQPFYILGEVFGKGVQDLQYGTEQIQFRVFDIYFGYRAAGKYCDSIDLPLLCEQLNIEMVPLLYSGPFSKEKMLELTDGREMVSGTNSNIREGIVIKPQIERQDLELGRVVLKSISEEYLLRKHGTEFN